MKKFQDKRWPVERQSDFTKPITLLDVGDQGKVRVSNSQRANDIQRLLGRIILRNLSKPAGFILISNVIEQLINITVPIRTKDNNTS